MSQLDLFPSVSASVSVFPLARRASLVRGIADELMRIDYDSGRRLWVATLNGLRRDLRRAGIGKAEINHEIEGLSIAVRERMLSERRHA